jgi:hypothetical protein
MKIYSVIGFASEMGDWFKVPTVIQLQENRRIVLVEFVAASGSFHCA